MNGSYFEFSLQQVRHVLTCSVFFFFNASISNGHLFEFLGRKHSNVFLKRVFYAPGEWKMVPFGEWLHLSESQLISPVKVLQVRGHANPVEPSKSPSCLESHATGVYCMWRFARLDAILYNIKNVQNTHGGVLLFVKLQASASQM